VEPASQVPLRQFPHRRLHCGNFHTTGSTAAISARKKPELQSRLPIPPPRTAGRKEPNRKEKQSSYGCQLLLRPLRTMTTATTSPPRVLSTMPPRAMTTMPTRAMQKRKARRFWLRWAGPQVGVPRSSCPPHGQARIHVVGDEVNIYCKRNCKVAFTPPTPKACLTSSTPKAGLTPSTPRHLPQRAFPRLPLVPTNSVHNPARTHPRTTIRLAAPTTPLQATRKLASSGNCQSAAFQNIATARVSGPSMRVPGCLAAKARGERRR
jgi:hypothetical protein